MSSRKPRLLNWISPQNLDGSNKDYVDWDNLIGTGNRAFRSERYSGYARKTLRQAIWVLRREISSRGAGQGGQRLERGILRVEAPVKKPPISRVQEMGGGSLHLRLSLRATVTRPVCRLRSLRCSSGRLTGHRRSAGNQRRHRSRPSSCLPHTGLRWARPLRRDTGAACSRQRPCRLPRRESCG